MSITRKLIPAFQVEQESYLMPAPEQSGELPMQSKVAASMDLAERLERRQNMEIAPMRSNPQQEHAHHVCNMCGKPSEITICDECSERLRIEALARKKHEEQGNAWSHWEG